MMGDKHYAEWLNSRWCGLKSIVERTAGSAPALAPPLTMLLQWLHLSRLSLGQGAALLLGGSAQELVGR